MEQHDAFQRLLVPLDGSALAARAVPAAVALAARLGVPSRLLFVIEGWDQVAQVLARTDGEVDRAAHSRLLRSSQTAREAVDAYLDTHAQHFAARGLAVDQRVIEGRVAATIVAEARREPGTVVVMTTHGHGGLSRLLMGSTAQDVLQRSDGPVLLLRSR